ncbi:peptidoglycan/LPS O-acetylase OafA/YrhL [Kineosphaera limosa]|uniref:Putative acyltransferase n=1 Tax=Kineosphaera limosa NBRC 100340 TaxID=1184609 RepID=K6WVL5_9MICO|nr:acyltransferase [Kineosphaera limosa]NYE01921.1 peptidoglycan/LPS O-acetylase OafA/YrhL [Kineosphaera limosa]GAB96147.1 putative acyltransferase [Kineosphaera limosa NBRC 100340]
MGAQATRARARALSDAFDPRSNSLDMLRLILATTVAVMHASAIAYGHQPRLGRTEVGDLAVDGFFVLSGFLVTRSYLQLGSPGRYAWHRFLRIMPGFWTCLVVTALVVAPVLAVLSGVPVADVLGTSWRYVLENSLLYMRDYSVSGLPITGHEPQVVNGPLWTLWYEAVCYVLIAIAGVAGVLRRPWLLVCAVAAAWLLVALQAFDVVPVVGRFYLRCFVMFMLGALGLLLAHRIPVRRRWLAVALLVLAGSLVFFDNYRVLGAAAFAYLCLYAMVGTTWLRHRPSADLSYGMYVYHWPIQTVLVAAGATALTQVGYTVLSVLLAALVAYVSWQLVEKRALAQKSVAAPWGRDTADPPRGT